MNKIDCPICQGVGSASLSACFGIINNNELNGYSYRCTMCGAQGPTQISEAAARSAFLVNNSRTGQVIITSSSMGSDWIKRMDPRRWEEGCTNEECDNYEDWNTCNCRVLGWAEIPAHEAHEWAFRRLRCYRPLPKGCQNETP